MQAQIAGTWHSALLIPVVKGGGTTEPTGSPLVPVLLTGGQLQHLLLERRCCWLLPAAHALRFYLCRACTLASRRCPVVAVHSLRAPVQQLDQFLRSKTSRMQVFLTFATHVQGLVMQGGCPMPMSVHPQAEAQLQQRSGGPSQSSWWVVLSCVLGATMVSSWCLRTAKEGLIAAL